MSMFHAQKATKFNAVCAWSKQGSKAAISTKYRKTAHQKWIAQKKAPPCRNRPLARSARRYKGVIGESKEGIGGTRNPPCPPWPPEAPKIKGKIKDYHLRKPNARKNRKPDPRRIQDSIERTLKEAPRKTIKECLPYSTAQRKKALPAAPRKNAPSLNRALRKNAAKTTQRPNTAKCRVGALPYMP